MVKDILGIWLTENAHSKNNKSPIDEMMAPEALSLCFDFVDLKAEGVVFLQGVSSGNAMCSI